MLDKTYQPQNFEEKLYEKWEKTGAFAAGFRGEDPYTIMMPPANVTGTLHLGHSLTFTLQDVLIRYQRLNGKDTLWQPGVDHAGIATQMVVERQLEKEGVSRHDLGREAFVDKVWQWKEKSGGAIVDQLRKLGSSADWERERFTMDEGLSEAVRKVFIKLYEEGLIYRDKRLVNWDPHLKTAVSNLEVETKEQQGHLWYLKYPLKENPNEFIVVATTRPETMLGDTGVAVHPEDERYKHLIGKTLLLPLVDREIPIVADEHSDPEKGSGAVKITPAHDFNDFMVGKRQNLESINILDENACLNDQVPEKYQGLDRFEARKVILKDFEALGLLEKEEAITHAVPYGDRSGVMIEPWLTDQWYVDAKTLAGPAIEAVKSGRINFAPKQWENTYFEWLNNIEPWCISRQIWWGHDIPAWYGPDGEVFVAASLEEAQEKAAAHYGKEVTLTKDPDVLDTWFSSALWPFSTLGWPEVTPELERYYPTDVLVTGFDIIFFWVARMIMFGMHFMKEVPFKTVYIHALIRDEKGQKMSKSKGNVIDPLELIGQYGTDALRFTLVQLSAQGRDIRLSPSLVEVSRNFMTKIWNAARYLEMNEVRLESDLDVFSLKEPVNLWLVEELRKTTELLEKAYASYRFNDVANTLYQFTKDTFCDWYVEFSKSLLKEEGHPSFEETKKTMGWVFGKLLHLIHPVVPYVTEEIAASLGSAEQMLIAANWPVFEGADKFSAHQQAAEQMNWLREVITAIRASRAELNIPPKVLVTGYFSGIKQEDLFENTKPLLMQLARLKEATLIADDKKQGCISILAAGITVLLEVGEVVDINAERGRLEKQKQKQEKEITGLLRKLENKEFVANAPEHVIEEQRIRLDKANQVKDKVEQVLQTLSNL